MITANASSRPGDWELRADPPDGWGDRLQAFDGGFFHSPPGLQVGAPSGTPIYARYRSGEEVLGLATGVQVSCRMSQRLRHAYFPSWPVFDPRVDRVAAIDQLAATLREHEVAEVRWDSFDAGRTVPATSAVAPSRHEFVLALAKVDPARALPAHTQHRRSIRRGDREGLAFRSLEAEAATEALRLALAQASARAALRGVHFSAPVPEMVRTNGVHAAHWGIATFAAYRGDTLLAAALIGHGPTRAYYVLGGATPEGYDIGASIWLHARIAAAFAERGLQEYNLGGVPATAVDPADPAHGLYRFKSGFGAQMIPCAGARWDLAPLHSAGHRLAGWAANVLPAVLR